MRYTLVMTLLLLTTTFVEGQNIKWDANRNLKWNDFQGPVDVRSKYHAQTQSGVNYSYRWQSSRHNTTFTFEVFAYCDKTMSWVKQAKETNALLAHEQLHFDISELHARILKEAITNTSFTKSYESQIKALFDENKKARERMQEAYDRETDHMNDREQQKKWNKYVAEEILRLQQYADLEVVN